MIVINLNTLIIYKIVCNNKNVKDLYVGSTTDFNKMIIKHKQKCDNIKDISKYNLNVYKTIRNNGGFDNWTFEEIENFACKNIKESNKRKTYWIDQLNSTLNKKKRTYKETIECNKIKKEATKQKIAEIMDKINILVKIERRKNKNMKEREKRKQAKLLIPESDPGL